MLIPTISLGTIGLYLSAGALLLKDLISDQAMRRGLILTITTAAILLHSVVLYLILPDQGSLNLGFTYASSLAAWLIVFCFLIVTLFRPTEILGILILPLSAATVLIAWLWPPQVINPSTSAWFSFHMLFSLAAYALLSLAMVQSLIMYLLDRQLKTHNTSKLLVTLPPLEVMERLLFTLVGLGFSLLTLGLISGVEYSVQRAGSAFLFNHHTVLAIIAWLIFGILLVGRIRFGWRGQTAIRWTLGGFIVLLLAYFGTKFVLEFLLSKV